MSINDATPEEWNEITILDRAKQMQPDLFPETKEVKRTDAEIQKPLHYNQGSVECIEGIEAMLTPEEYIGYLRGNSLKYRWRFPYKHGIKDIYKAEFYEAKLLIKLKEKYSNLEENGS